LDKVQSELVSRLPNGHFAQAELVENGLHSPFLIGSIHESLECMTGNHKPGRHRNSSSNQFPQRSALPASDGDVRGVQFIQVIGESRFQEVLAPLKPENC
jgi:hypothetical protein